MIYFHTRNEMKEKLMLGMKFFKRKDKLFETVVELPHHYM